MAIGNDNGGVAAGAVAGGHLPFVAGAFHVRHRAVELHQRPQSEVIYIIVEITRDQAVMGEVRPIGGHRKILELQPCLGCVDVQ